MQTVDDVMQALERKASAQTRKVLLRHGAPENLLGVKVGDLKVIAKKLKGQQELACALYETGQPDAMYLAAMVADGRQMTKRQIETWARQASWGMLSEYAVPWIAAESPHARTLALKWIRSKTPAIAGCGWSTYSGIVATQADEDLDLQEIRELLARIVKTIDAAPDRVRYGMNGFVISVGAYVQPLLKQAKAAAKKIGVVDVDMGETACKVPLATAYIEKVESMGRVGKKRKTMRC